MTDKHAVLYRFTPQFKGARLEGVPKRDLTAKDVANLTAQQRADAFAPHPLYGTPLYTPTEEIAARQAAEQAAAAEAARIAAEEEAARVAAEEAARKAAEEDAKKQAAKDKGGKDGDA